MVKLPMTFTADEDIQKQMKDDNIGSRKKSEWINDKIKKGLLVDKTPDAQEEKPIINTTVTKAIIRK